MEINKEILIYSNTPYKKFRWVAYFSIAQFGFLSINLFFLPTNKLIRERQEALDTRVIRKQKKDDVANQDPNQLLDEFEPNPDYDPSTIVDKFKKLNLKELFTWQNLRDNTLEKPYMSFGLLSVALAISAAFSFYAHRTIHTITLMPGERVRISFFTSTCYGKPPSLETSIRHISCVSPRKSNHNYSILKLKGYFGYHLISKKEGQFLHPKLFDKYLGYSRSWAQ